MKLAELQSILKSFVPDDGRPLVIYSGIWQFARRLEVPTREIPHRLIEVILNVAGPDRTVLMPTYTGGFREGVVDLDTEPSRTGVLTEAFRKHPDTLRTASAFFSFACSGPDASFLAALRPDDAWGDGSVLDWVEKNNAEIITLGESWDFVSITHLGEWKARVPYRYPKTFTGTMIYQGSRQSLTERLFVRSLSPDVHNNWRRLDTILPAIGMRSESLGSGQIASVSAQPLLAGQLEALEQDPFCFTQDPDSIRNVPFQHPVELHN